MQFAPLAALLLLFSSAAATAQTARAQPPQGCVTHSQVAVLGAGAAGALARHTLTLPSQRLIPFAGISAAAALAAAGVADLAVFEVSPVTASMLFACPQLQ